MISSTLVRHPAPHPTESLPGYVLRLSEANGCASPRNLYRLAEMNAHQSSLRNFACSKFAAIANLPTSLLDQIALKSSKSESEVRLLGNVVSVKDLNLTRARVCPECVEEKGFIEAHWLLEIMVACPVHERSAFWYCSECRSPLSWIRSGLLICKCGSSISSTPRDSYSESDLWLLDLIRRKAIGDRTNRRSSSGMPDSKLGAMNLHSLLSLVRFLGKRRMTANWSKKKQKGRHLLQAAATVLADWPHNFEILLQDICPRKSGSGEIGAIALAEDLSNIYEVVHESFNSRLARYRFITT
jgi:hypothetical protein